MINYGSYFDAPVEVDDEYDYWFQKISDEAYDVFKRKGIEDNKMILTLAEQRVQEERPAWDFFDECGLTVCHAYALLDRFEKFKKEFKFPEPDLDIYEDDL